MIKLQRSIGLFPAMNIVIANMIGAGIFTTSGILMNNLHSPVLMLGLWIAGGLLAFCGAIVYGGLAVRYPEAGGEYYFLHRIFHPSVGFLSGWVSFTVGFSAPIAASALGVSEYLVRAFPSIRQIENPIPGWEWLNWPRVIAIIIILLFTTIHTRKIRFGTGIQNILTLGKVILLIVLVITGFLLGKGSISNFTPVPDTGVAHPSLRSIGLSIMWIMFAYSGWNAATYIGSEIKNPARNLPWSLLLGTITVLLLYITINILYVYALSPDEMNGIIAVAGQSMKKLFGPGMDRIASLMIAFALFSSLSAYMIIGPRVYYAMARDHLFFKPLSRIHTRRMVPTASIWFQSVIALVFVLTGTFDQILTYMGFALGIFPIITAVGSIVLHLKKEAGPKMALFPVPHLIFIGGSVGILILAFLERPLESSVALITVLAGIPFYRIFVRTSLKTG